MNNLLITTQAHNLFWNPMNITFKRKIKLGVNAFYAPFHNIFFSLNQILPLLLIPRHSRTTKRGYCQVGPLDTLTLLRALE